MHISVILCTFNRCESLAKTLESLAVSEMPDDVEWEILVVDNNSSDQTKQVVDGFCQRDPLHFRYLFEGKQGKSNALNSALKKARGHLLAFTDDDVIVTPQWLHKVTKPLETDEWAGVAGRIRAAHDFECPEWLSLEGEFNLDGVLALYDQGEEPRSISKAPYGANMAFRKEVFKKYGSFRTDLGRTGKSLLSDEDTEFGRRVLAHGDKLWYEPSAIVFHGVSKNRLQKDYFLKFWYDMGRTKIRINANRDNVWKIPRWCISVPIIAVNVLPMHLRSWIFARDPKRRFFFKCFVWRTLGEMRELPYLWFEERRKRRSAVPGASF